MDQARVPRQQLRVVPDPPGRLGKAEHLPHLGRRLAPRPFGRHRQGRRHRVGGEEQVLPVILLGQLAVEIEGEVAARRHGVPLRRPAVLGHEQFVGPARRLTMHVRQRRHARQHQHPRQHRRLHRSFLSTSGVFFISVILVNSVSPVSVVGMAADVETRGLARHPAGRRLDRERLGRGHVACGLRVELAPLQPDRVRAEHVKLGPTRRCDPPARRERRGLWCWHRHGHGRDRGLLPWIAAGEVRRVRRPARRANREIAGHARREEHRRRHRRGHGPRRETSPGASATCRTDPPHDLGLVTRGREAADRHGHRVLETRGPGRGPHEAPQPQFGGQRLPQGGVRLQQPLQLRQPGGVEGVVHEAVHQFDSASVGVHRAAPSSMHCRSWDRIRYSCELTAETVVCSRSAIVVTVSSEKYRASISRRSLSGCLAMQSRIRSTTAATCGFLREVLHLLVVADVGRQVHPHHRPALADDLPKRLGIARQHPGHGLTHDPSLSSPICSHAGRKSRGPEKIPADCAGKRPASRGRGQPRTDHVPGVPPPLAGITASATFF